MKEIIEAGGAGFILPTVLFALILYVVRGVFTLHGRRGQHRREFLELWNTPRIADDLWLEVSIRHLFGTYLPGRVIRIALERPNPSQSLGDLAEIWDLFKFNPEDQTISWARKFPARIAQATRGRPVWTLAYFLSASLAFLLTIVAAHYGSTRASGWIYGVCAITFGFFAITCLKNEEAVATAQRVGNRWIALINSSADISSDGEGASTSGNSTGS